MTVSIMTWRNQQLDNLGTISTWSIRSGNEQYWERTLKKPATFTLLDEKKTKNHLYYQRH